LSLSYYKLESVGRTGEPVFAMSRTMQR